MSRLGTKRLASGWIVVGLALLAGSCGASGETPLVCDDDVAYRLTFCLGLAVPGPQPCDAVCALEPDERWTCGNPCGDRVFVLTRGSCELCRLCAQRKGFVDEVGHPWDRHCDACASDADCWDPGQTCHDGRCVDCVTDGDCADVDVLFELYEHWICLDGRCESIQCRADADCQESSPFCLAGFCRACREDVAGDCGLRADCLDGFCEPLEPDEWRCERDDQCDPDHECHEGWCRLVPPCFGTCDGRECGDDGCGDSCGACARAREACVGGQCVCQPNCGDRVCGDDGCEGSCGACADREHCAAGVCQLGAACRGDIDCPELRTYCDPETETCRPGCLGDRHCAPGESCVDTDGGPPGECVGESCTHHFECAVDQMCDEVTGSCGPALGPQCEPCDPSDEDACGAHALCSGLGDPSGEFLGNFCMMRCMEAEHPGD